MQIHRPRGLSVAIIAAGLLVVALTGFVDTRAGSEIPLWFFYFLIVALAARFSSTSAGVVMAVAATAAWVASDIPSARDLPANLWEAASRLGAQLIVVYSMGALRRSLLRERSLDRTDPLTGIPNSRAFREGANTELNRAKRFHRPLTVAFVDVDDFKAVNDNDGREAGDRVLRTMAAEIRNSLRVVDLVARLGGDEFSLLLPETDPEQAKAVITKIQQRLATFSRDSRKPVTLSIGVMTYFTSPASVDEMLKDADDLMYAAKTSGKNTANFDIVM